MSPNSQLKSFDPEINPSPVATDSSGKITTMNDATRPAVVVASPKAEEVPLDVDGASPEAEDHIISDDFEDFLKLVDGVAIDSAAGGAAPPALEEVARDDDSDIDQAATKSATADEKGNDDGVSDEHHADDAYIGLVPGTTPRVEEEEAPTADASPEDVADAPSLSFDNKDEQFKDLGEDAATETAAIAAEGGGEDIKKESSEGEATDDGSPSSPMRRRASNERKAELHDKNLMDSVKTVDSLGGAAETLPPIQGRHSFPEFLTTSGALVDGKEAKGGNSSDDNNGNDLEPQDKAPGNSKEMKKRATWSGGDPFELTPTNEGDGDGDNTANYIDWKKLDDPSANQYYYSQANRANRQVLEKVKSKRKPANRSNSLDQSGHSARSGLSQRQTSAAYRGPTPRRKDGSFVKSAFKKSTTSIHNLDSQSFSEDGAAVRSNSVGVVDVSNGSGSTGSGQMKRCAFSYVDVREHERIAGDNPCVTSGVPLSIGWGYYQHGSISLDDYEINKGPSRDKIEMMVPASVRRSMLREEFGVRVSEMNAAMKEVNVTKRQRRHTVASEHLEGWHEVLQSAKRKFKRFVKRTSTAKEQERIWQEAHQKAMGEYLKKNGEGSLGANPEVAGAGPMGVGPRIAPENSDGSPDDPFLEISFNKGEGDSEAPTF